MPIFRSISFRRAAASGLRSLGFSLASIVLVLLAGSIASPLHAQDTTPQLQPKSSSSSVPQETQSTRRSLENRRLQTKQRREAALVTETYTHRWEFYVGGEYMRFRPGPDIHNSGMGGWIVGATRYFNPRFGIIADARGLYGNNSLGAVNGGGNNTYNAKFAVYPFTIGPIYRFYGNSKFSVSGVLQLGDIFGYFDKNTGPFPPQSVGFYPASNVGAAIASIHLDYNLSPGLAVRLSPHMLIDNFGGDIQHNQGIMLGMVYRFGRQ
ncbi:MAG TPA: hypothetical protein VE195_03645 [Acidobacteriaceae bacterium]|nr:hypothetical protein [Acidobacteriaceae bacterium]